MGRTTYSVIVTWREGEAQVYSLGVERFDQVRQCWIDEGYDNLQTEWYERKPESTAAPDRFRVFAYWEDGEPPTIDQLRAWGMQAPELKLQE